MDETRQTPDIDARWMMEHTLHINNLVHTSGQPHQLFVNAANAIRNVTLITKGATTDQQVLQRLLELHTAFLMIPSALDYLLLRMPPDCKKAPVTLLLQQVLNYHDQHQKPETERSWMTIYNSLNVDQPTDNPVYDFYVWNYRFLVARNAGTVDVDTLRELSNKSLAAVERVEPRVRRHQLWGFAFSNLARLELNLKSPMAIKNMSEAARSQLDYLMILEASGSGATGIELNAARTQVWKIRHDWASQFGDEKMKSCPISEDVYRRVEMMGVDTSHSAQPKPI